MCYITVLCRYTLLQSPYSSPTLNVGVVQPPFSDDLSSARVSCSEPSSPSPPMLGTTHLFLVAVEESLHYLIFQIVMVDMWHPVFQFVYVYFHIFIVVYSLFYLPRSCVRLISPAINPKKMSKRSSVKLKQAIKNLNLDTSLHSDLFLAIMRIFSKSSTDFVSVVNSFKSS